jgi:hypothetical protein|tara:strand:+ start:274 stop:504 length:231 start_codon:yes stop_codon:yes gene_type:complete
MITVKQNPVKNDSLLQENELYTIGLSDGREHQRVKYLGNKLLNGKPMMVFATTDQRQITINPSFHTFTITERKRGQ